jgi:hypothetical protein
MTRPDFKFAVRLGTEGFIVHPYSYCGSLCRSLFGCTAIRGEAIARLRALVSDLVRPCAGVWRIAHAERHYPAELLAVLVLEFHGGRCLGADAISDTRLFELTGAHVLGVGNPGRRASGRGIGVKRNELVGHFAARAAKPLGVDHVEARRLGERAVHSAARRCRRKDGENHPSHHKSPLLPARFTATDFAECKGCKP